MHLSIEESCLLLQISVLARYLDNLIPQIESCKREERQVYKRNIKKKRGQKKKAWVFKSPINWERDATALLLRTQVATWNCTEGNWE